MRKIWHTLRGECSGLHLRLLLARIILAPLPAYAGNRLRALVLRAAGFAIGRGTFIGDLPSIIGSGPIYHRLTIGQGCWINIGCVFELGDAITIGDRVAFGPQVTIVTSTHTIGASVQRSGQLLTAPVSIGAGAWLGARATILPGVTIGAGSVVAAGAVVTKAVPANTLVAGVPARIIRTLD